MYVCVSLSYDLPQKPKPPWKSTTRFRVWHLSVRRYHQAYKSLFVYVSLAGFGHICPFFSTFCHFFTRTCEAHLLHIYTCSTYTFDFFDFCRTFCGFFRRANCRLPTQNLVWTLTSAHELGNWATELSQTIYYMLYAICYICDILLYGL